MITIIYLKSWHPRWTRWTGWADCRTLHQFKNKLLFTHFLLLWFFIFCFLVVRLRSYQKVTVEIMKSSRKTLREEKPTEEK